MVYERPPAAFGGSPPREGETRAKRARGSLTHHLAFVGKFKSTAFSRGYSLPPLCYRRHRQCSKISIVFHFCSLFLLRASPPACNSRPRPGFIFKKPALPPSSRQS